MSSEHKRGVKRYLYYSDTESYFYMVATDFNCCPQVKALTGNEYKVLMDCISYSSTSEHGKLLYKEFEKYFNAIGTPKDPIELKLYAGIAGRSQKKFKHNYFTIPPEVSEEYGHSNRNHFTQTLNRLEKYGFIKCFSKAEGQKRGDGFSKDQQTIWEFVEEWKQIDVAKIKDEEKKNKRAKPP